MTQPIENNTVTLLPSENEKQKEGNPRGNPNWVKGKSGNPNGRPKNPEAELLRKALQMDAKKYGHLIHYAVKRARKSDVVLIAILKKILPDMTEADFKGTLMDNGTRIVIVNPIGYKPKDERLAITDKAVSG